MKIIVLIISLKIIQIKMLFRQQFLFLVIPEKNYSILCLFMVEVVWGEPFDTRHRQ